MNESIASVIASRSTSIVSSSDGAPGAQVLDALVDGDHAEEELPVASLHPHGPSPRGGVRHDPQALLRYRPPLVPRQRHRSIFATFEQLGKGVLQSGSVPSRPAESATISAIS